MKGISRLADIWAAKFEVGRLKALWASVWIIFTIPIVAWHGTIVIHAFCTLHGHEKMPPDFLLLVFWLVLTGFVLGFSADSETRDRRLREKRRAVLKKIGQAGFTSVEMVLVSMLILSVMALVVKQAAVLSDDSKAAATMGNVRSIASVIQSRLGDRENYLEVSNTVVQGFLPGGILPFDGAAFVSPFSTSINTRPSDIEGGALGSGFEIDVSAVPMRACSSIVMGLSSEFEEILINRTVVKTGGVEVKPVVQDVLDACAASGRAQRVRLRFKGAG